LKSFRLGKNQGYREIFHESKSAGEMAMSNQMSQSLPLVTIGIPTFNRAHSYLPQALESAVRQTYINIEIIVADNCSTDSTESLVSAFNDPRIRYFRHPMNIGPFANADFCLDQARGDYFLLLHSDDMIDSDFIETCMAAIGNNSEVGVVRTGTRAIDENSRVQREAPNMVRGLSTEEFFRGWFSHKTPIYLCSTLFATDKLRLIGGLKSKHYCLEDAIAIARLAALYGRVDVESMKASFRYHGVNMGDSLPLSHWCEESHFLLDVMVDFVPNKRLVRQEGMRFFSNLCYRRVAVMKSPLRRFIGHFVVFRKFGYLHLPPPITRTITKMTPSRLAGALRTRVKRIARSLARCES
jgi:glycosyltransferase involved in cell wall biosynthesis